jgi:hypothetical protein
MIFVYKYFTVYLNNKILWQYLKITMPLIKFDILLKVLICLLLTHVFLKLLKLGPKSILNTDLRYSLILKINNYHLPSFFSQSHISV